MQKPLFLIAPMSMHKELISFYRSKDAFLDVKAMSIEELSAEIFGSYLDTVVKDLSINYQLNRDNAEELASYFTFIDLKKNYQEEKLKYLQRLKASIKEEFFVRPNYYISQLFNNREILVYGYLDHNEELKRLLSYISNKDVKYCSLGENKKIEFVEGYASSDFETLGALNKIAELIDQGVNINDIYILYRDEIYAYYLAIYKDDFGFNINIPQKVSFASLEKSKEVLERFKESQSLEEAIQDLDENDEIESTIISIAKNSFDERFSFEAQYDFFLKELQSTYLPYNRYKDAVSVLSSYSFLKNKHVFVLGFKQGNFPPVFKDNNYLPDKIKKVVGMNTSIDKALESSELFKQFLSSDNHFYLSFAKRDISKENYLSPLAKSLDIKLKEHDYQDVRYSKDYAEYDYTVAKDLYRLYLESSISYVSLKEKVDIPYLAYDNQFDGAKVYLPNTHIEHSYSKINTYYACPFQYYLDRILGLSSFESNFNTKLGNLAHKIFEKQNDDDFDFDEVFNQCIMDEEFNIFEIILAINLKERIIEASKTIDLHQKYMQKPFISPEINIKWQFSKYASLVGKVDKVVSTADKYLYLVDYKTGSESFNPKYISYGRSLQLPTYALLAKQDKRFSEYKLSGVYINHVVDKSYTRHKDENELIYSYLKLDGLTVLDLPAFFTFDSTISGGKSSFVNGVSLDKKLEFIKSNVHTCSKEDLDKMVDLAEDLYKKADENIRNNRFEIHPFYGGEYDDACQYCEFRDVCFKRTSQRNIPVIEKEEDQDE